MEKQEAKIREDIHKMMVESEIGHGILSKRLVEIDQLDKTLVELEQNLLTLISMLEKLLTEKPGL